ncbi:radical SAM protein [Clostridium sp. TF11-13AC]|uniref:radical SAM protein n=1 Tax=Clostridium sp. TF11-13AC TaxID=2293053 RepID=UPI000E474F57|nr:radical SAM protein [Clostridium sp. TF11-13AC]RHU42082.1 radical SAM protein [Clostridium sp. TF11-13AC]
MNSKVLYIRVNKNCNAQCLMCDFWKNPKMEISEDQFRNVLSQFESIELVRFTGGEPLLCDRLPQYIRMCHELGIKTSVITNGLLLEDKLSSLVDNGLNQIIISVDGPLPGVHDRIRGTDGLLKKIENSLSLINRCYPDLHTRVNTVVSHNNISQLSLLVNWLKQNRVEQWSIIPIKMDGYIWKDKIGLNEFRQYYEEFQRAILQTEVKLLGYSRKWAGSIDGFWNGQYTIHSQNKCNLVKYMSFYDPFSNHIFPCNCVPHRSRAFADVQEERDWYYENGYMYCKGCEPLNAYCSDFPEVVENDVLDI